MKRTNVLFVMMQMGMGGSERLVHSLALRLDRSRFNPSVAWFSGDEVLGEFADLQVPLHYIPKRKRVDFSAVWMLRRIIETNNIDIVNAQHFMPAIYSFYGCKVAANRALAFTAHSRWEVEQIPLRWRLAGGYLLRRADASIGVAPDVSRAIQTVLGTRASLTWTIENGVDTEIFGRDKDVRALRTSLKLADGDVVIGIVASLKQVKNHLFLLQAFARLARDHENVKLLVIGQGSSGDPDNTEDDLRCFVNSHGLTEKVRFLGHRTDVPDLLRVLDVFCLVSLREGLPMGLIEAMAAGLPTVGTNVEGIRDTVTPNVDGILVELGDVTGLQDAIIRLMRSPQMRQELGKAGRDNAVARYSLQRCVRDYERLFSSLMEDSGGP